MVVVTVTCFLVSLATSIPRNNYNIEKKKRHDIFVNYWFIFSVGSPLTARIFTLGNTCTCISSISHWMFGFQLDQSLSNERVWCSSAIQQNPLPPKKNGIDHSIFEVSQTLSWVIEQSGTRARNTRMEQNQMFQFQTVDGKCVSYWSSVKAFKAMQGPASFIISISELNSKINILFTKEKVFKSASWNHLRNHLSYYSSLLSGPQ